MQFHVTWKGLWKVLKDLFFTFCLFGFLEHIFLMNDLSRDDSLSGAIFGTPLFLLIWHRLTKKFNL